MFSEIIIRDQIKEELAVPNPDGSVLCISNTVVMGKDHFLSLVFLEISSLISCQKIYFSINFTFFFLSWLDV